MEILSSANQGAMELRGAIAIAVFLDDKEMFDNVIESALYHPAAGLTNVPLEAGQFADFGRDMGHAGGMLVDWARVAEIAWHQGVDLYGLMDNRLMKCIEYFCEYNMADDDWTDRYRLFGAGYSWYRGPSSDERGKNGEAGVIADRKDHDNNFLASFYLYRGAYENRKGLSPLTYTKQYAEEVIRLQHKVENAFIYTRGKHEEQTATVPVLKQTIYEIIKNPVLTTADNTNEVNLEQKVIDGKTVYLLSGKGYNSSSSCLAYYEMQGDGALVVKIGQKPEVENNGTALVGLMIRESMDENSRHEWVYIGDRKNGGDIVKYYSNTKRNGADINVGRGFTPGEKQQYPIWLKLERHNGRICSYDSYDGETWLPLDLGFRYADETELPDKYLLGLVVTSKSSKKDWVAAEFTDVKLLKYKD